jgi:hypothetical protein
MRLWRLCWGARGADAGQETIFPIHHGASLEPGREFNGRTGRLAVERLQIPSDARRIHRLNSRGKVAAQKDGPNRPKKICRADVHARSEVKEDGAVRRGGPRRRCFPCGRPSRGHARFSSWVSGFSWLMNLARPMPLIVRIGRPSPITRVSNQTAASLFRQAIGSRPRFATKEPSRH